MILHRITGIRGFLLLSALCFLPICSGCDSGDGFAISGRITLDGNSVEKGVIRFVPAESGGGGVVESRIEGGKYGVRIPAGKRRVEIVATAESDNPKFDPQNPTMAPMKLVQSIIPEKYNNQSELTADVSGGNSSLNFELSSK